MRLVTPPRSGARLQRSVAASLASILEIDPGEVPVPDERHPQPWTVWNQWLALRGLGLVPIDGPARFSWPGPWLAVLTAAAGEGAIGAVAFGSPPGIAWKPFDGPEGFEAVEAGYVIAPADIALWRGIDLNALLGHRFTVGGVECLGQRLCEPCAHLERLTAAAGKPGTLRALIHKGGLRADIVGDGEIHVGDEVIAC